MYDGVVSKRAPVVVSSSLSSSCSVDLSWPRRRLDDVGLIKEENNDGKNVNFQFEIKTLSQRLVASKCYNTFALRIRTHFFFFSCAILLRFAACFGEFPTK